VILYAKSILFMPLITNLPFVGFNMVYNGLQAVHMIHGMILNTAYLMSRVLGFLTAGIIS